MQAKCHGTQQFNFISSSHGNEIINQYCSNFDLFHCHVLEYMHVWNILAEFILKNPKNSLISVGILTIKCQTLA